MMEINYSLGSEMGFSKWCKTEEEYIKCISEYLDDVDRKLMDGGLNTVYIMLFESFEHPYIITRGYLGFLRRDQLNNYVLKTVGDERLNPIGMRIRGFPIDIDEPELFRVTLARIYNKWEDIRFGIEPLYAPADEEYRRILGRDALINYWALEDEDLRREYLSIIKTLIQWMKIREELGLPY